jgi:NADH-quinone oxidoreductase subunit C
LKNGKDGIVLKVNLPKENPEIPTITDIYKTANWQEREIYDLFGINFISHPNLKRILLPERWEGHPLRKDYVFKEENLIVEKAKERELE